MNRLKGYYVYMLRCSTGELYTGYTVNLEKRIKAHNKGVGSRFTKARLPTILVYSERLRSRREAMRRERQIKRKSRKEKIQLIAKAV